MTTIYILEQGSYLKVKHQQFHVLQHKQVLFQVPVNQVENIILFGYCHLSHGAVQTALFKKIPIIYYSSQGYYLGSLQSQQKSKVTYLKEQVRLAENEDFVRRQAEIIVRAKLHNARILLMRINRRRPNEKTERAITELKKLIKCLAINPPLQSLRGYEGKGASIYFQGLGSLFQGNLVFENRTLRPPADPINSLLDCCDLDWRSPKTQLIIQEPPYFASQINEKRPHPLIDLVEVDHERR